VPELAAPRESAIDTAPFVPRAILAPQAATSASRLAPKGPPGFVYEVAVKAFSKQHPGVSPPLRGRLAALAEPCIVEHLHKLEVTHVELMPIAAWIDERHLPPLGLGNAWGYNPITFMAPDPRLAPAGIEELERAVASLHQAGIAVILDVVYNHSGEGDAAGPTVSLRGLDNAVYYRHFADDPGKLVNDTACGNTLASERAPVTRLVTDAMRHWVAAAGIDGFRFDLATALGRAPAEFTSEAPLFAAIAQDPLLRDLILIAEPWDVGPQGYRLGQFPVPFLEWNDKYRDDVRRFWKGESGLAGALATRLAGSSDIFQSRFRRPSRSLNFVACHDGFALADLVAYSQKHNEANGEGNRDGNNDNHSWNNGVEGETKDAGVKKRRLDDIRALLSTLFLSRGTPMLTAGDELGRTQRGNNNAYSQDNELGWIDWSSADHDLANFTAGLSALRAACASLRQDAFFNGTPRAAGEPADVVWLAPSGQPMRNEDWAAADILGMAMTAKGPDGSLERLCVIFNRGAEPSSFQLPDADEAGFTCVLDSAIGFVGKGGKMMPGAITVPARSVTAFRA
jgi:glycogen operon protein